MSAPPPSQPSLPWRATSSVVMGVTGFLSRCFLFGFSNTEVIGLDRFLGVLDGRKDVQARERGLLTVSNHISILDDPLMWGVLPFRYAFNPDNHRWSLASHDLCFQNKATSLFFSLGQTLPIHRTKYSPYGGLFQPTMTQAIRLLSAQPFSSSRPSSLPSFSQPHQSPCIPPNDPFSSNHLTYSTNGSDTFPAPSAYPSRRHSWIHIFPEGFIHQHPSVCMRYFKWGVARLILEAEPLPTIIPIFISGTELAIAESRGWPRFLPRPGHKITVAIGEQVDGEKVFGELRRRWRELVSLQKGQGEDASGSEGGGRKLIAATSMPLGDLTTASTALKNSPEAISLRKEVTRLMRLEVLKVRRDCGFPDEDPKASLVETWLEEGPKGEGRMDDGSWVKDP